MTDDRPRCALFRRTDGDPCHWIDVTPVEWNSGWAHHLEGLPLCSYHHKKMAEQEREFRADVRDDLLAEFEERLEALRAEHAKELAEVLAVDAEWDEFVTYANEDLPRGLCTYVVKRQGWVKIGRTTNLRNRLGSLRRGNCAMPVGMHHWEHLILLATFPGDIEKELHLRWHRTRVRGTEWFETTEPMREWLDEVCHVTA